MGHEVYDQNIHCLQSAVWCINPAFVCTIGLLLHFFCNNYLDLDSPRSKRVLGCISVHCRSEKTLCKHIFQTTRSSFPFAQRLTSLTHNSSGSAKLTAILAVEPCINFKIFSRASSSDTSFLAAGTILYFVRSVANTAVNSTCANSDQSNQSVSCESIGSRLTLPGTNARSPSPPKERLVVVGEKLLL